MSGREPRAHLRVAHHELPQARDDLLVAQRLVLVTSQWLAEHDLIHNGILAEEAALFSKLAKRCGEGRAGDSPDLVRLQPARVRVGE